MVGRKVIRRFILRLSRKRIAATALALWILSVLLVAIDESTMWNISVALSLAATLTAIFGAFVSVVQIRHNSECEALHDMLESLQEGRQLLLACTKGRDATPEEAASLFFFDRMIPLAKAGDIEAVREIWPGWPHDFDFHEDVMGMPSRTVH